MTVCVSKVYILVVVVDIPRYDVLACYDICYVDTPLLCYSMILYVLLSYAVIIFCYLYCVAYSVIFPVPVDRLLAGRDRGLFGVVAASYRPLL